MYKKKEINPKFAKWMRTPGSRPKDEIISTPWHLKLDKSLYIPKYLREPENMNFVMSGEYERLWHQGREIWLKKLYELGKKELKLQEDAKKIRAKIKAENDAAKELIQKQNVARMKALEEKKKKKEAEFKAKIEKIREKTRARAAKAPKKGSKEKGKKDIANVEEEEEVPFSCPPGYELVEVTLERAAQGTQAPDPDECCTYEEER